MLSVFSSTEVFNQKCEIHLQTLFTVPDVCDQCLHNEVREELGEALADIMTKSVLTGERSQCRKDADVAIDKGN